MRAAFRTTILCLLIAIAYGCGRVEGDPILVGEAPTDAFVVGSDSAVADAAAVDGEPAWILDTGTDVGVDSRVFDVSTEVDPTLVALRIDPSVDNLTIGTSKRFNAIAERADGTSEDVSASALWTMTYPAAAKVSGGLVTGLLDCLCGVTAHYGGKSATAKLRIWHWVLVGVTVQPSNPSIYIGDRIRIESMGTWSDGAGATATYPTGFASWSTLGGGTVIALTSAKTETTVLGVAAGVEKVRATYDGFTGEATITVTDHGVAGLEVSPYAATIFVKGVADLVATLRYKDGTSSDVTSTATWTSSDPKIASVSGRAVTGVSSGTATITASASGLSGTSTITVTSSP